MRGSVPVWPQLWYPGLCCCWVCLLLFRGLLVTISNSPCQFLLRLPTTPHPYFSPPSILFVSLTLSPAPSPPPLSCQSLQPSFAPLNQLFNFIFFHFFFNIQGQKGMSSIHFFSCIDFCITNCQQFQNMPRHIHILHCLSPFSLEYAVFPGNVEQQGEREREPGGALICVQDFFWWPLPV